jgi:hypothetical protein
VLSTAIGVDVWRQQVVAKNLHDSKLYRYRGHRWPLLYSAPLRESFREAV